LPRNPDNSPNAHRLTAFLIPALIGKRHG